jgi:hypothetical protein
MAAATPMGKDKSMVTNIVNNEPIIAPLMPACSGSLESPWMLMYL